MVASALARGVVGGIAYGLVVATISHPFDTLKSVKQASAAAPPTRLERPATEAVIEKQTQSVSNALRGLPSQPQSQRAAVVARLYRGVGPAMCASVLLRTVPFVGYEAVRGYAARHKLLTSSPVLLAFIAGAAGGVMRGSLETPAELVKTRLQLGYSWRGGHLLRGLGSTTLRTGAVIGVYWALVEASRGLRAPLSPALSNFAAGGICSIAAWALIYPLDTAKSCIQAGSDLGILDTLVLIYKRSGVAGLYAGIGAGLLRAFLANGAGMVAYGFVQQLLSACSAP